MKAVLDACVLYPTVMREILLGVAAEGAFRPLWSARILEEWARAAARDGDVAEAQARGEIAILRARWPAAEVPSAPGIAARLWLPDENDVHVLATAIAASADLIVTLNATDFPRATLAEEGLARRDPDTLLTEIRADHPARVAAVVETVRQRAERDTGRDWPTRALLKKARLPRLGKALGG